MKYGNNGYFNLFCCYKTMNILFLVLGKHLLLVPFRVWLLLAGRFKVIEKSDCFQMREFKQSYLYFEDFINY